MIEKKITAFSYDGTSDLFAIHLGVTCLMKSLTSCWKILRAWKWEAIYVK